MPRFFAITFEDEDDEQFAEPIKPVYESAPPSCPQCGMKLCNERWVPPYNVAVQLPLTGDVFRSFIGVELLVSHPLAQALAPLKGVEHVHEVRVVSIAGRTADTRLYSVQIVHSHVRVDFDACSTTWTSDPEPGYCRFCGPGGGERKGCTWSYERLVLDLRHWDAEEIFYPINLAGTLIASDDAIRKAKLERFSAVRVTPIEQYRFSYGLKR